VADPQDGVGFTLRRLLDIITEYNNSVVAPKTERMLQGTLKKWCGRNSEFNITFSKLIKYF